MKFILSACAALLSITPVMAQQYPTIVGEWYAEQASAADCGGQHAIRIGAMSYADEALVCKFDDVRRDGWQVTWNGSCNDGSTRVRTKVVAVEKAGSLSLSFNGNAGWSTLRRCTPGAAAAVAPAVVKVPLHYQMHTGDSEVALRYWPDAVQAITDVDGADALSSKLAVFVAEAGGYTFSMASSMYSCGTGAHGCPMIVFRDDVEVGGRRVCQSTDLHSISADGRTFYDCSGQGLSLEFNK